MALAAALILASIAPAALCQDQFDDAAFETYAKQISDPDRDKSLIAAHKLIEALAFKNGSDTMAVKVRGFLKGILANPEKSKASLLSLLKAIGIKAAGQFNAEVIELIHAPDEEIRQGALDALAKTRDDGVLEALAAKFSDEKSPQSVRLDAIAATAALEIWAIEKLVETLRSGDRKVTEAAQSALMSLTCYPWGEDHESWSKWWAANKGKPVDRILREANARKDGDDANRTAKLINPKNLEQNLFALREYRDERVLLSVLRNIEGLGDRKSVDPLLDAFKLQRSNAVRTKIVDVLGLLLGKDDVEAGKILLGVIESPGECLEVKAAAVRAAGKIREINSIDFSPPLAKLLSDENPKLRAVAAESIGKIGRNGKEVVAALLKLLTDTDDEVRRASARALGELKADEAVGNLLACIADPDPNMRWCVVSSLGLIGNPNAGPPLTDRLSVEKEPRILEVILSALVQLRSRDAVPKLAAFIKQNVSSPQGAAALETILKVSSQSAADLKAAASELLKAGLKAEAMSAFERIIKDFPESADEARESLADLGAETGRPAASFDLLLDLLSRGAGSKDVFRKAFGIASSCAEQSPAEAVKCFVRLCSRTKSDDNLKCLLAVADLHAVEKDAAKRAEILRTAAQAIKDLGKSDRRKLLSSAAKLVDPSSKEAGLRMHLFLSSLFPEPPAPALTAESAAADWTVARETWLTRLNAVE